MGEEATTGNNHLMHALPSLPRTPLNSVRHRRSIHYYWRTQHKHTNASTVTSLAAGLTESVSKSSEG